MTDFKFEIDGKKLSREEIKRKKDFDTFYKNFQRTRTSFYRKNWFWASTGFASLAISFMLMLSHHESNEVLSKNKTFYPSHPSYSFNINQVGIKSFAHQFGNAFKPASINLDLTKSFVCFSKILPQSKKQHHFINSKRENKECNYPENDSLRLSKKRPLPDKNPTTITKNCKSEVVFPDNFVPPHAPEYQKQKKRRIQIQK